MAQDLEQMVLSISADTRQIQRALKKLETNSRASTKKIEQQFDGLGKKVSESFAGFGKNMVATLAAAFSLREAQKFIDTATRIDNALKVAGLSGDQLIKVYDGLFASAQKNAAPLEALVQLYGRVSLVQKELGVSSGQLLKFTDNVAVALRVSGKWQRNRPARCCNCRKLSAAAWSGPRNSTRCWKARCQSCRPLRMALPRRAARLQSFGSSWSTARYRRRRSSRAFRPALRCFKTRSRVRR
jgi:hypothetical protein